MAMAFLIPFLLMIVSGQSGAQLVKSIEPLQVDIGRAVYLQPLSLQFNVQPAKDNCRVQIIADHMTQRVGSMEPKVFDCFFPPYTVQYIHSGNPLLKKDRVKVQVHHLTATETVSETFYLSVEIVDTPYQLIMTEHPQLQPVIVSELSGQSNPIDYTVVRFRYHQGIANCTVGYSRYRSVWPLIGRVMKNVRGQWREVDTFKWDCHEFMSRALRYEHFGQPTPEVDYLPLTVEVNDPEMSRDVLVERLYLPIRIKGAFPNMPPKADFMSMYIMDVDEFVLSTVIPGVLSATDSETPAQNLVFNISKPLGQGQGYMVNLEDHSRPISSFTQEEMKNNLVAYRPPSVSHPQRMLFSIEFTVFDSHYLPSSPILLDIAVRPSATDAPRVSINAGLTLLEGQSRPIRLKNFQIVDNDNIDSVKIFVKSGVHHGRLTVRNQPAMMFTVSDLESDAVVYHHDDSNSVKDFIDFRITDGQYVVRSKFPINILPKDDSPPFLITNLGLNLKEGQILPITDFELYAHDDDSSDDYIIYDIVTSPKHGEVIKMYRRTMGGDPVSTFYQAEISRGFIYYRHFGGEHFEDSFEVILQDRHNPPNVSPKQLVTVTINSVSDISPQLVVGATQSLEMLETEVALILPKHLSYSDFESNDDELVYKITTLPYYVNSRQTFDAGKVISVDELPMLMKDPSIPAIRTFKQSHVKHHKIAYMPPMGDIGTKPKLVNFIYMVEDTGGNKVREQKFQIRLLPVNTQPPILKVSQLVLKEGTFATLTLNEMSAFDEDTPAGSLIFSLEEAPKHGHIMNSGVLMVGANFTVKDLKERRIRYVHDGSEAVADSYQISVSDGLHRSSQMVSVELLPVDDQAPQFIPNLKSELNVQEGQEVTITTAMLSATDVDTAEEEIYFLLVSSPKLGQVHRSGQMTTVVTQKDLQENSVSYVHMGGEVGAEAVHDSLTFLVSDKPVPSTDGLPLHDIKVTITPVDNQRPRIILGSSILVQEAGKKTISREMLDVTDLDSKYESIEFVIVRQAEWGFIENVKPSPGSEKSNAGKPVDKFKMADVLDGVINYVQGTHESVEPLTDNLVLYATDGVNQSPQIIVSVTIVPENDELPEGVINDISVTEGGEQVLHGAMFQVTDADRPKNMLMVSVDHHPMHGKLILRMFSRNTGKRVELPIHDFEFESLRTDMALVYQHDGSEDFEDKFTLKISDGKHEVFKQGHVNVTSMNDERPSLIKNTGLHINFGGSAVISGLVLQSHDPDNGPNQVYYLVTSPPRRGSLQMKRNKKRGNDGTIMWDDLSTGSNFTQKDVDMNIIRYINTGLPSRRGTDKFKFRLTDGINFSPREVFEIEIKNARKGEIAIVNKGLKIEEGERLVIAPSQLSAVDDTNAPEDLTFTLTNSPLQGHLELSTNPGQEVNEFSQMDILGSRLTYVHTSRADLPEDLFTFTASNGVRGMEKSGVFVIKVTAVDRILPTLDVNKPLTVMVTENTAITSEFLHSSDPDTSPVNVTFTIARQPDYGVVTNKDSAVERFTQADIDAGFVEYRSTKKGGNIDRFVFTVDDGRHKGFFIGDELQKRPATFNILIESIETQPPELIVNEKPEILETFGRGRYGFILGNTNLKASDKTSVDSQIVYVITRPPRHGYLQQGSSQGAGIIGQRLRQHDIDNGGVVYILREDSRVTNDSFTFRLQDTSGHTSNEYRYVMSWSSLEFSRPDYSVCESAGVLSINILRTGSLHDSSYAEVAVRGSRARLGEDFELGKTKQVQFSPGMKMATYNIIIKDDDLEEPNEKIRLVLKSPVNAILGETAKTVVQIVNSVNGRCPYSSGMIGGDEQPTVIPPSSIRQNNGEIVRTYHGIVGTNQDTKPVLDLGSEGYSADMNNEKTSVSYTSETSSDNKSAGYSTSKSSSKKTRRKQKKLMRTQKEKLGRVKKTSSELSDAVPRCSDSTAGLIRHDAQSGQLFKCDGLKWKEWSNKRRRKARRLAKRGKGPRNNNKKSGSCPKGWVGRSRVCYSFKDDLKTWNEAQRHCKEEHSANLVRVESKKHLRWLAKMAGKRPFWIGLNDKYATNQWEFVSGHQVAFTKWKPGQPSDTSNDNKHCVLVRGNKRWERSLCHETKARFICFKEFQHV